MVNQVEIHPFNQQIEAKKWNDKYNIQLEEWTPFGEGRRGIVVILKSTHKERMIKKFECVRFFSFR